MRDLSTVRGQLPEIHRKAIDIILLNIHTLPASDMLTRFEFEFTPTYLIFAGNGEEVFRSNTLLSAIEVIQVAQQEWLNTGKCE